jgi:hypothetical protein
MLIIRHNRGEVNIRAPPDDAERAKLVLDSDIGMMS